MAEHQHTPTPWTCHNFKVLSPDERRDLTEPTVAYCGDYRIAVAGVRGYDLHHADEADAAFIVRACNAHDAMVAALSAAERALSGVIETAFTFDELDGPEEPCHAEELCGEALCAECGCIKDKRDDARAALRLAEAQQ